MQIIAEIDVWEDEFFLKLAQRIIDERNFYEKDQNFNF